MNSPESLHSQVTNYLILTAELKAQFTDIDQETLTDTLEGISALPEAIAAVVRSSLDDAALIGGLKGRLEDLEIRLERLTERHEKKRALARWAMQEAGLDKLAVEDFSVGLRKGTEKLEVLNEASIPTTYFVLQPAKLDRKALLDDLKRGNVVGGVRMVIGESSIQVRVR